MKQPNIQITDINGKDWGCRNIISMTWGNNGKLWCVIVDFMNTGKSIDFLALYDYEGIGEFTNSNDHLKGVIINEAPTIKREKHDL